MKNMLRQPLANYLVATEQSGWIFQTAFLTVLFNTLRLRQDGLHFPDDIFNCIFLNENI